MSDGAAFPDLVNGISPINGSALNGGADDVLVIPRAAVSVMIPVTKLHPHPDNIRDDIDDVTELAASIRAHGVLQNLTVVPHTTRAGHYFVVAGHRRLEAARVARLAAVPCAVRQTYISVAKATTVMLIENWQREDLGPMEKARGLGRIRDEEGKSSVQIAREIGISTPTVSTYLALLELCQATQDRVAVGDLSVADAVAAVRHTRARTAVGRGGADRRKAAALTWEPDHWTARHPLARKAAALCDAREHNLRRRVGKVACGQCWEAVIRADERLVVAAAAQTRDVTALHRPGRDACGRP